MGALGRPWEGPGRALEGPWEASGRALGGPWGGLACQASQPASQAGQASLAGLPLVVSNPWLVGRRRSCPAAVDGRCCRTLGAAAAAPRGLPRPPNNLKPGVSARARQKR